MWMIEFLNTETHTPVLLMNHLWSVTLEEEGGQHIGSCSPTALGMAEFQLKAAFLVIFIFDMDRKPNMVELFTRPYRGNCHERDGRCTNNTSPYARMCLFFSLRTSYLNIRVAQDIPVCVSQKSFHPWPSQSWVFLSLLLSLLSSLRPLRHRSGVDRLAILPIRLQTQNDHCVCAEDLYFKQCFGMKEAFCAPGFSTITGIFLQSWH